MKRWREKTERKAAEILEVPKDTLEHVPRIMMIGDLQVVIENYKRIVEFGASRIRIGCAKGEVVIRGQDLVIKTIVPEELVVEGIVTGIDFT